MKSIGPATHVLTKLQQVREAELAFTLAVNSFPRSRAWPAFSDLVLHCRGPGMEVRATSLWSPGSLLQPFPSSAPGTDIEPPDVYLPDFPKMPLF